MSPRIASPIATVFGVGRSPVAPGTMGSIAALPAGALLLWLGGWEWLLAAIVIVSLVGAAAGGAHALAIRIMDPSEVVIDEIAGQWIALLPAALAWPDFLLAFALFRLFDIWKPGPIGWSDRNIGGGLGIMCDDLLAGIAAAAVLGLIKATGVL